MSLPNIESLEMNVARLSMKAVDMARHVELIRQNRELREEMTHVKAEAKAAVESSQVAAREAREERQSAQQALAVSETRASALEETLARERRIRVELENNPPARTPPPPGPPTEPPSYDMVVTERTASGRPQKVRLYPVKG